MARALFWVSYNLFSAQGRAHYGSPPLAGLCNVDHWIMDMARAVLLVFYNLPKVRLIMETPKTHRLDQWTSRFMWSTELMNDFLSFNVAADSCRLMSHSSILSKEWCKWNTALPCFFLFFCPLLPWWHRTCGESCLSFTSALIWNMLYAIYVMEGAVTMHRCKALARCWSVCLNFLRVPLGLISAAQSTK